MGEIWPDLVVLLTMPQDVSAEGGCGGASSTASSRPATTSTIESFAASRRWRRPNRTAGSWSTPRPKDDVAAVIRGAVHGSARAVTTTSSVWAAVVGQPWPSTGSSRAAAAPVHAYLFVGPAGSTKKEAARSPRSCSEATTPQRAHGRARAARRAPRRARGRPGRRLDLVRSGVRSCASASLAPIEGDRKVMILDEFHLLRRRRGDPAEDDRGAATVDDVRDPRRLRAARPGHDLVALRPDRVQDDPRRATSSSGCCDRVAATPANEAAASAGGSIERPRVRLRPRPRRPPRGVRRGAAPARRHERHRDADRRRPAGAHRGGGDAASPSAMPPRSPSSTSGSPATAKRQRQEDARRTSQASSGATAPTNCSPDHRDGRDVPWRDGRRHPRSERDRRRRHRIHEAIEAFEAQPQRSAHAAGPAVVASRADQRDLPARLPGRRPDSSVGRATHS